MVGVIILHYNNPLIGGALRYVEFGSINYYFLNVVESIFVSAVDLFMIISGFFMASSTKRDMWKPIQLFSQVIIFSVMKYILLQGIRGDFQLTGVIKSLIPSNYFVVLYVVVFLISPYLNLVFEKLNRKQTLKFMILLFAMFSIYPTIVDVLTELTKHEFAGLSSIGAYGSQYGYTVVNFALCYCVGVYIKKNEEQIYGIRTNMLLLMLICSILILTVWSIINDLVGCAYSEKSAWEYCNPIVILSGVLFFLLFKKMNIGRNKVINLLAQGSFTVYLLHSNLISHIGIEDFVNKNIVFLALHMFFAAIVIYILCWCVYFVYSKIEQFVFANIKKLIHLPVFDI